MNAPAAKLSLAFIIYLCIYYIIIVFDSRCAPNIRVGRTVKQTLINHIVQQYSLSFDIFVTVRSMIKILDHNAIDK